MKFGVDRMLDSGSNVKVLVKCEIQRRNFKKLYKYGFILVKTDIMKNRH